MKEPLIVYVCGRGSCGDNSDLYQNLNAAVRDQGLPNEVRRGNCLGYCGLKSRVNIGDYDATDNPLMFADIFYENGPRNVHCEALGPTPVDTIIATLKALQGQ